MKIRIGIEIHIEIKTKAKIFSFNENKEYKGVNVLTNPIDNGEPGTLPVVNVECIKKAILLAQSLNMDINNQLVFERKNYFYYDLPKGFQITQKNEPIAKKGKVVINLENYSKEIEIEQIQLEEDTIKQIKKDSEIYLNFNRSGSPLIELITTPCFTNYSEVIEFLKVMINNLRSLDISEARMEKGEFRVDVNISLSNTDKLGIRTEIKNINSLNNIKKAIEYETKYLEKEINLNKKLISYTKNFDEKTKQNIIMRRKMSNDQYVFIVEPNLPIFNIKSLISEYQKTNVFTFLNRYNSFSKINTYNHKWILLANNNVYLLYDLLIKMTTVKDALNIVVNIYYANQEKFDNNYLDVFKKIFKNLKNKEIYNIKKVVLEYEKIKNIDEAINRINNTAFISMEKISSLVNKIIKNNPHLSLNSENKCKNRKIILGLIMKEYSKNVNPKDVIEILNSFRDN